MMYRQVISNVSEDEDSNNSSEYSNEVSDESMNSQSVELDEKQQYKFSVTKAKPDQNIIMEENEWDGDKNNQSEDSHSSKKLKDKSQSKSYSNSNSVKVSDKLSESDNKSIDEDDSKKKNKNKKDSEDSLEEMLFSQKKSPKNDIQQRMSKYHSDDNNNEKNHNNQIKSNNEQNEEEQQLQQQNNLISIKENQNKNEKKSSPQNIFNFDYSSNVQMSKEETDKSEQKQIENYSENHNQNCNNVQNKRKSNIPQNNINSNERFQSFSGALAIMNQQKDQPANVKTSIFGKLQNQQPSSLLQFSQRLADPSRGIRQSLQVPNLVALISNSSNNTNRSSNVSKFGRKSKKKNTFKKQVKKLNKDLANIITDIQPSQEDNQTNNNHNTNTNRLSAVSRTSGTGQNMTNSKANYQNQFQELKNQIAQYTNQIRSSVLSNPSQQDQTSQNQLIRLTTILMDHVSNNMQNMASRGKDLVNMQIQLSQQIVQDEEQQKTQGVLKEFNSNVNNNEFQSNSEYDLFSNQMDKIKLFTHYFNKHNFDKFLQKYSKYIEKINKRKLSGTLKQIKSKKTSIKKKHLHLQKFSLTKQSTDVDLKASSTTPSLFKNSLFSSQQMPRTINLQKLEKQLSNEEQHSQKEKKNEFKIQFRNNVNNVSPKPEKKKKTVEELEIQSPTSLLRSLQDNQ